MRLIEIHVLPKHIEIAYGLLIGFGLSTIQESRTQRIGILRASVTPNMRVKQLLNSLRSRDTSHVVQKIRLHDVKSGSWRRTFEKYLKPIKLLKASPPHPALTIDPLTRVRATKGEQRLLIRASMAFGTGSHPTTHLCAQLIDTVVRSASMSTMLDVGCGSGILSLIGRLRGVDRVDAVDIDPDALSVTQENARQNRVQGITTHADIRLVAGRFDLIVANIELNPLIALRCEIMGRLAQDGALILSGLLCDQVEELIHRYRPFRPVLRLNKHNWSAVWLARVGTISHGQ